MSALPPTFIPDAIQTIVWPKAYAATVWLQPAQGWLDKMEKAQYQCITKAWSLGSRFPKSMLYGDRAAYGLGFSQPKTVATAATMVAIMHLLNADDPAVRGTARYVCLQTLQRPRSGDEVQILGHRVYVPSSPRKGTHAYVWVWWLRQVTNMRAQILECPDGDAKTRWEISRHPTVRHPKEGDILDIRHLHATVVRNAMQEHAHNNTVGRPWLGLPTNNHRLSNSWKSKTHLSRTDKQLVYRLQANTYPHYANLQLWKVTQSAKCRLCGAPAETLSHAVAGCQYWMDTAKFKHTFKMSNARHNDVFEHFKRMFKRNATWACVMVDTPVTAAMVGRQLLDEQRHTRPDAIYVSELMGMVIVVDQAVPFDMNLASQANEKVARYSWLLEPLKRYFRVPHAQIVPIPLGALGGVPQTLIDELTSLAFAYTEVRMAVEAAVGEALKGTCKMIRMRARVLKLNRKTM